MTTDWQTWGLEPPSEPDRDRLVILGGGRGLVVGAPWNRSYPDGKLDDRFYVTWTQVRPDSLMPTRGDIVLWRGYSTTDPEDWGLWGAPTRVLRTERHGDRIDVWSVEDSDLSDRRVADDLDHSLVEHDRILDESELWSVLGWWGLNPYCPRCGGELQPIMYGMPLSDPGPGVIVGGCVPLPDAPMERRGRGGYEPVSASPFI